MGHTAIIERLQNALREHTDFDARVVTCRPIVWRLPGKLFRRTGHGWWRCPLCVAERHGNPSLPGSIGRRRAVIPAQPARPASQLMA